MADIIWLDEVGSTNDAAKDMLKDEPSHGTVISARRQTNGRGQYGRKWLFEDGAAAFSVILKFEGGIPENLTVRVGECVLGAIEDLFGKVEGMHIKLPNDILIGGKKICGILTEAQTTGDTSFVICGIGIDINCEKIPQELSEIATSLFLETGRNADPETLIREIQQRIIKINRKDE